MKIRVSTRELPASCKGDPMWGISTVTGKRVNHAGGDNKVPESIVVEVVEGYGTDVTLLEHAGYRVEVL